MCAVSMVTDYYKEKWPINIPIQPYIPSQPLLPTMPWQRTITEEQWKEYQELKRRMEEYDAKTGQPHCEKLDIPVWESYVEGVLKAKNDNI